MTLFAAIAIAALAFWMDTRAAKVKARHRIDCTVNGHSLIILPDGRRMGIGVTNIRTECAVDDVDRVYVEGFLQTPEGSPLVTGRAHDGPTYKAGTVVHDTTGKRVVKAWRVGE